MQNMIYFDNAATTFPKPEIVYKKMDEVYRTLGVNSGRGSYKLAREASKIIINTREKIADMANLNNCNKVIFTASATQAMNQIICGLKFDERKTVYVTPFEHNAVMRPLNYMQKKYNFKISIIPFDPVTFELDIDKMKLMFSRNYPDYIFMSHVSNVTGYIIPIEKIIKEAQKYESVVTLDCAQSMGLIPINLELLNVDYLIFAGHKTLYGPFGVAGYIDKSKVSLSKFIVGGTGSDSLNLNMPDNYPDKYESGSKNIYAIAGLNFALDWIKNQDIQNILEKETKLTKRLIEGLKDIYGIKLYIPQDSNKQVGIISFNLEDYNPNELGQVLDYDFNIAVRTGYHCAPLIHDFLGTKDLGGTVRVSLGYFNTEVEINNLIDKLERL